MRETRLSGQGLITDPRDLIHKVTIFGFSIGANSRTAGRWLGGCVAVAVASLVLYVQTTSFGWVLLVFYWATAVAVVLAAGQAFQNGSTALSWLLAATPTLTAAAAGVRQPPIGDVTSLFGLLVTAIFLGL